MTTAKSLTRKISISFSGGVEIEPNKGSTGSTYLEFPEPSVKELVSKLFDTDPLGIRLVSDARGVVTYGSIKKPAVEILQKHERDNRIVYVFTSKQASER